ncbi:hypothetical protein COT87_02275 [Candidatus Collierbacteria bacterium CG10_big_fil_rev_8_21_14_0_10_44_9]|uniref:Uncharacterized protein n=1 Tax=Candidatus Collierbacteria bacterium CG10_big_fil_rev_8_21_14_0_10_44_9 TaxID=1974535 RepID=A0A2H0VKQ3_9BACT|nr:MAG: hypothetical protein COT87_02275 [Candidatus Collierbacteria bacterium CG10_big_fil_rev_8_21_14_0_10_44_9]
MNQEENNNKFLDSIIMPQKKKTSRGRQGETKAKTKTTNVLKTEVLRSRILQNKKPGFWNRVLSAAGELKLSMGLIFKILFVSKIGVVAVILFLAVPMTAFEAHVVNVTATIERRPCEEFEVRSMGFWKTHQEERIFPQAVGDSTVTNNEEASGVFNLPNNVMANKLKKQLLAMKFSIAYFGAGLGTVGGGDPTTLSDLVNQADGALLADPQNQNLIAYYHNLIEEINISHTVSTCPGEAIVETSSSVLSINEVLEPTGKEEKEISGETLLPVEGANILEVVSGLIVGEEDLIGDATSTTEGDLIEPSETVESADAESEELLVAPDVSDSQATSTEEGAVTEKQTDESATEPEVAPTADSQLEPEPAEEPVSEPEPASESAPEPTPDPEPIPHEPVPPSTEPIPTE